MSARLLTAAELPLEREARIVFALARRGAALPDVHGVDWPRLAAWGRHAGATIALQRAIVAAPDAPVPDEARRAISAAATQAAFAQLYLRQRLERSLDVLARAGVTVMPLKGAAFLLADPAANAARAMGDIDLLIRLEDVATARAVLLDSGWVPSVFESRQEFYAEHHHLPPFDDASGSGLSLEVHTDVAPSWQPLGFRAGALWATARPHPTRPAVLMPAPREMLLHACIHFTWAHMGRFGAWRLAHDVDALVSGGRIEWADFVRAAAAQRAGTSCYWALRFVREVAGVAVPDEVLDELAPALPAGVLRALARHLSLRAAAGTGAEFPSVWLERLLWRAMVQPARSGHGGVRPWAREGGRPAEQAQHGRERAPVVPTRTRVRRVVAHLWRSIGGTAAAGPGSAAALARERAVSNG